MYTVCSCLLLRDISDSLSINERNVFVDLHSAMLGDPYCQSLTLSVCASVCLSVCLSAETEKIAKYYVFIP